MNCENVQDLLPLYLSGELRGEDLVAMQLHMQACESCSKAVSADRDLDAALRTALLEDTPDVSALLHRVHAGMTIPWWKRTPRLLSARTVAVIATVAIVVGLGLPKLYVHQLQRTMALNAAQDHYSDLILQRHPDWTYEPQDVAHFIQNQFPQQLGLLALITPKGSSFEKVRVCTFGGARYAHFVFRSGSLETSVFLAPTAKGSSQYPAFHLAEAGYGLEVSEFAASSATGMVVANKGLIPTQEIANRLASSL